LMIVGLTGSIASGKSTVAEMFREMGAHVIDWDDLAREVVEPHKKAWNAIVDYFGAGVLNDDKTINRAKLGQIVFDDLDKLEQLNRITHPVVFEEDEDRVDHIRSVDPDAIIFKDIPLLIEAGYQDQVDKLIVVHASRENQIARMKGRGLSEEEAEKRLAAQMPVDEKTKFADFVIRNDGSLDDTRQQVEKIYSELVGLKK